MQQFNVPQFLDVESKIIGPLTTRQFLIMLVAFILGAAAYKIFDFSLFLIIASILFVLMIAFAFIKINGRPFHLFVLNMIQTISRPNTRVWNKNFGYFDIPPEIKVVKKEEKKEVPKESYKNSHLAELALIVDTKGRYKGD